MSLLAVEQLRAGYGDAVAIDEVSFGIADGSSLALLGRNGVGKTSLIATLMGHTRLMGGTIAFAGRQIEKLPPHRRPAAGLGWVPQERDIFPSLTVQENLTVAALPGAWDLTRVFALFPRLEERRGNLGNQLSGGEQQMLAIGRALMLNPKLLLLDEPLEGLAPVIVEELCAAIARMAGQGMAVLLVEQHAELALRLTTQALVLERGRIVHRGLASELLADKAALQRLVGLRGGAQRREAAAHV
jgi:branched-chain amino acid transport system ATP-binding protein